DYAYVADYDWGLAVIDITDLGTEEEEEEEAPQAIFGYNILFLLGAIGISLAILVKKRFK
ncbi:unnamed protein product, partial [marine sediment metagenome]